MSADREFQVGSTGRFNLTTRATPGGTPVAPDAPPTIKYMMVDGSDVDPTTAAYANVIAQRQTAASAGIEGRFKHEFDTTAFTRLSNVEFVYEVTINGITREDFASATFRDDPTSVPGFDAA